MGQNIANPHFRCRLLTAMRQILLALLCLSLSGCAVLAVADLAVTGVATAAKVGVKIVGVVVDVVIPDKKP